MKSYLVNFYFIPYDIYIHRNLCLTQGYKDCHRFSSSNFPFFDFAFRSMGHFELILICGVT